MPSNRENQTGWLYWRPSSSMLYLRDIRSIRERRTAHSLLMIDGISGLKKETAVRKRAQRGVLFLMIHQKQVRSRFGFFVLCTSDTMASKHNGSSTRVKKRGLIFIFPDPF